MKTIAFLIFSPFSQRDFNRFGIEILKKKFNVYVLDMSKLFGTDLNNQCLIHKFDGYLSINSIKEFKKNCTKLNFDFAVDFLDISPISYELRNFLKKKNVSITKVQNGLQPKYVPSNVLKDKIYQNIFSLSSWQKIVFTLHKLLNPKSYFFSDEILVGGLSGLNLIASKFSKTIIPCHSFDYDVYLNLKKNKKIIKDKYLVFVDQNLAFHPDLDFLKLKKIVDPYNYYNSLESFFKKAESFYNLKLIVASHPRSNYHLHKEIFKNRTMIKGKTAELIKDCEHVFMHASNALSYAVLYRKPISFISTNEINNSFFKNTIDVFLKFFSKKYLNIDNYNENDFLELVDKTINDSVYQKYEREFLIHPESSKDFFWEIYSEYILNKK